jgi:hypothetical protein
MAMISFSSACLISTLAAPFFYADNAAIAGGAIAASCAWLGSDSYLVGH